jgi:hypothetical protein
MKKVFFLIAILAQLDADAQTENSTRKRFIDKVEAFGGLNSNFPDDHGWSDFVFSSSNGKTIDKLKNKQGYFIGLSLIHSVGKRFELQGKFALEKKEYSRSVVTLDLNGSVYGESLSDQKSDYLTFSVVPAYFLSKSHKLHLFSGFSYAYINKSLVMGNSYIQGKYIGGAAINTIDGEKNVIDALVGIGYLFPLYQHFTGAVRVQGNYGLSYTSSQNKQSTSINSIAFSLVLRYSK